MAASGAVDAQEAFPQIAAAEVGVKFALDEGGQRAPVGFAGPPDAGPALGHTAMEEGLIEGTRLVGPGAEHSIIFAFFSLLSIEFSLGRNAVAGIR
jgi:hypothetical protein